MLGLASEPRGLRLRGTVSMHASCLDSKLTMALFSSACGSEQPSSSRAAGIMLTGPTFDTPDGDTGSLRSANGGGVVWRLWSDERCTRLAR